MAGPRARKVATRILTGDKEIDKILAGIGEVGRANRVARSGLSKAIRVIVKGMKSEVPSSAKSVKKAIKGYVRKNKRKGFTEAKVGAVGKQTGNTKDRGSKEGVGIGSPNVHWFILGTDKRRPKKKKVMKTSLGRFMGKEVAEMPAHPVVKEGWAKTSADARRVLKKGIKDAMDRETAKLVAKYQTKWGNK
jgi:hypothetical protein